QVVGVASLSRDGDEAELENLWVLPGFIGRGIGKVLFEHVAATARRQGCSRLRIVSDPNARAFYERMGARIDGDVPSRPEGRRLPCLIYDLTRHRQQPDLGDDR
ncbi:MAG: GNAT family N-acetyltransferase, partial [Kiloniellales bacterium]